MTKDITTFLLIFALGLVAGFFTIKFSDSKDFIFEYNLQCAQLAKLNQNKEVAAPTVFYSPKLNTCISAFIIRGSDTKNADEFYINNILNNESILSEIGRKDDTIDGVPLAKIAEEKYLNELKKLRKR